MKSKDKEQFTNKKNKIKPLEPDRFYPRKWNNREFAGDTVVVACSGPSLNKVKIYDESGKKKFPIIAVSTAIRKVKNPDIWCTAQKISRVLKRPTQYGKEGKRAFDDKKILKVYPASKGMRGKKAVGGGSSRNSGRGKLRNHPKDVIYVDNSDRITLSINVALDWIYNCTNFKNVLLCGCDLRANNFENKYSYKYDAKYDTKIVNRYKKLDALPDHGYERTLHEIHHRVKKYKTLNFKSWSPGGRIEEFMDRYED